MDTWSKLRGKTPGGRATASLGSRTPKMPLTPISDSVTIQIEEEERVENEPKLRGCSKVPSILNFGKQTAPTIELTSHPSPVFSFEKCAEDARDAESVWHNPSVDQMAEALKVNMMKKGNFQPVPVEFNSNVLHVLEAYWQQSESLKKKDKEIAVLQEQLENQAVEFEKLGEEWSIKEGQYKVEVKNLEVMVAHGVVGLEAVTLNRSKSVLDRTSSSVQERLRQIRQGSGKSDAHEGKFMTVSSNTVKEQKEVSLSKMFSEKHHRREKNIRRHYKDPLVEPVKEPHIRRNRTKAGRKLEMRFFSKQNHSPSSDSSFTSEDGDNTKDTPDSGLATNNESKPLPDIPLIESTGVVHTRGEGNMRDLLGRTQNATESISSHNRARSFIPGDDSYSWRRPGRDAGAERPAMDYYLPEYTPSTESSLHEVRQVTNSLDSYGSFGQPLRARNLEQFESSQPKRGNSKNSNSSMVTAIRDKPARGSIDMTSTPATSNDAIVAAQAAKLATGDNQSPSSRRLTYEKSLRSRVSGGTGLLSGSGMNS